MWAFTACNTAAKSAIKAIFVCIFFRSFNPNSEILTACNLNSWTLPCPHGKCFCVKRPDFVQHCQESQPSLTCISDSRPWNILSKTQLQPCCASLLSPPTVILIWRLKKETSPNFSYFLEQPKGGHVALFPWLCPTSHSTDNSRLIIITGLANPHDKTSLLWLRQRVLKW